MLRAIVPGFIKNNLDRYLLQHHPILWVSRIHYMSYFSILLWLISALIAYLVPIDLRHTLDTALWYVLFSILAIVVLCVWIYRNAIFNIEKNFGNRSVWDEYKVFFLNFLCVAMLITFAYPFTHIYNHRVAITVSDEELIEDINTANMADMYLPSDVYSYYDVYDSIRDTHHYDIRSYVSHGRYTPWRISNDTLIFPSLYSVFRLEQMPDYERSDAEITQLLKRYRDVFQKYGIQEMNFSPEKWTKYYRELCGQLQPPFEASFLNQHFIEGAKSDLNQVFENVATAKFERAFIWKDDFLYFLFYFSFYTTLFFMLFKNVQWQQFLITLVFLIVLPIVTFIIVETMPYGVRDGASQFFFFAVFLACLVLTICSAFVSRRFSAVLNISLQLFYLALPLVPIYIVFMLHEYSNVFHNYDQYLYADTEVLYDANMAMEAPVLDYRTSPQYHYELLISNYWQNEFHRWLAICQYGGILFFLLLGLPFSKQLFVKHLALPRKK